MPQVPEIEIKEVKFLIPARVTMEIDGKEVAEIFNIDLANKDVVAEKEEWLDIIKEKIFEFLSRSNLSEDQFEAGEDVYEEAARAQEEFDLTCEKQV
jgi:hypothetical protein